MPQEEQDDWPSFETVLRDVAPDSPTVQTLTKADKRAQLADTAAAIRATRTNSEVSDIRRESLAQKSKSFDTIEILPAPLPPLELDTSSVLELLAPIDDVAPTLDDPALAELAPEPELLFDLDSEPKHDEVAEVAEPDVLEPELEIELEPEPEPEIAELKTDLDQDTTLANETATPFDEDTEIGADSSSAIEINEFDSEDFFVSDDPLVFALDESTSNQIDAAHNAGLQEADAANDLFSDVESLGKIDLEDVSSSTSELTEEFEPLATENDQFLETAPESLPTSDNPFSEVENQFEDTSFDLVESESSDTFTDVVEETNDGLFGDDLPEGETLVLDFAELGLLPPDDDEAAAAMAESSARSDSLLDAPSDLSWADETPLDDQDKPEPFATPSRDLFDVNSDDQIDGQGAAPSHTFDAVAAANEIETDLGDLAGDYNSPELEEEAEYTDNVVPLRPDLAKNEVEEDTSQASAMPCLLYTSPSPRDRG